MLCLPLSRLRMGDLDRIWIASRTPLWNHLLSRSIILTFWESTLCLLYPERTYCACAWRPHISNSMIIEHNIDVMAICETWLKSKRDTNVIKDMLPNGYSIEHTPRRIHSVGPHSDKPRSLELRPLSRIPFGRCPLSRIPFSRTSFILDY